MDLPDLPQDRHGRVDPSYVSPWVTEAQHGLALSGLTPLDDAREAVWDRRIDATRSFWTRSRVGRGYGPGRNPGTWMCPPSISRLPDGEDGWSVVVEVDYSFARPDRDSLTLVDEDKVVAVNTATRQRAQEWLVDAWIATWCLHPDNEEVVTTGAALAAQVAELWAAPGGWTGVDPSAAAIAAALLFWGQ